MLLISVHLLSEWNLMLQSKMSFGLSYLVHVLLYRNYLYKLVMLNSKDNFFKVTCEKCNLIELVILFSILF